MLDLEIAKGIARTKIGSGFSMEEKKSTDSAYLFMCKAEDESTMPSIIAIAVNKNNGKVGSSFVSFDEALNGCMR